MCSSDLTWMTRCNLEREKDMQYAVEMRRVTCFTVFVDAESAEQAKAMARERVQVDFYNDGDQWVVQSVDLVETN